MTQEEKQLLLQDLCARLPYGVMITDGLHTIKLNVRIDTAPTALAQFMQSENLRYYLRPMSSMTEEEKEEFNDQIYKAKPYSDGKSYNVYAVTGLNIDWLNTNHFDYRGLIEKGLAIEAPEGMYGKEASKCL